MDVVLKAIHYNLDCFLKKIVEDFEDYVKRTTPGCFWKTFRDVKKQPTTHHLICFEIHTKNMERALAELKTDPGVYLNDFDEIKKILEGAPTEEKIEEWLNEIPCHLYIFYNTVMYILWRANWRRYTTALGDTGKE